MSSLTRVFRAFSRSSLLLPQRAASSAAPDLSNKTVITAAVCGHMPTKGDHPKVPYSPKEVAEAALECWRAGAAGVHIHIRDPQTGWPSSDLEGFREVVSILREKSDVMINLTTSAPDYLIRNLKCEINDVDLTEKRLEPLVLNSEIASLDVGCMNFARGDLRTFINSPYFCETALKRMKEKKIKPELEVFDTGHIAEANHYISQGLVADPPLFQLCMGVRWGIPPSLENLIFLQKQLPKNAVWSAMGVGLTQLPMITLAALLGGHVRVGFEDNVYRRKGQLASNQAEMVEMAVKMLRGIDREPATPAEARQIFGIPSR